jgi:putative two-component system response regulator
MENHVVYDQAKILIVDDQTDNIELLERILRRAGYTQFRTTTRPKEVPLLFLEYQPDIILLDLRMPEMDGRELLQLLNPLIPKNAFMPIIILTADISPKAKREALLLGAKDFLTKPLDSVEVLLRIRNLLQTRFLNLEVQLSNQILEEKVRHRTHELEMAQVAIIECLAKACEFRDDATGEHTQRVGILSSELALALGYGEEDAARIGLAASLHDIGKIGIPDEILLKPSDLTETEFSAMQKHTTIGKEIISNIHFPVLGLAQTIAFTHHERWDGTGYPSGLKGDAIPLEGQIVAIVDVYDALTHQRPYKTAWKPERAIQELVHQSGKQFNPKMVKSFLEILKHNKHVNQVR